MINYKEKYDLPDFKIVESEKKFDISIWNPKKLYVVLGKSDSVEDSVNKNIDEIDFTVVKRPSGGHSVILTPKTVVISSISRNKNKKAKVFFKEMNAFVIDVLKSLGVENLYEKGISDISIGEKKILGSSIFKARDYMFYHAVLNHSEDIELIEKLLTHPKREPDYRKGRTHKDFVTSLKEAGYSFSIDELAQKLSIF